VARFNEFKYGDGTKYGSAGDATPTRKLTWGLIVAWDGQYSGENEAFGRMESLSVSRGRQRLIQPDGSGYEFYQPGQFTVVLDNEDGRYDPRNSSSPLYPNVSPGKFCRLMVKHEATDTTYHLMRGMIQEIQPFRRGLRPYVRIVVRDALEWLRNIEVRRGWHQNTPRITLTQYVYEYATGSRLLEYSPQYTEWPFAGVSDGGSVDAWWAWRKNALDEIRRIMTSEGGGAFFHDGDGNVRFWPIDFRYQGTTFVHEEDLLTDISNAQPWDLVRNQVRVTARPVVHDAAVNTLWTLDGVPIAIADGEAFVCESHYRYEQFDAVSGVFLSFIYTVNDQADGLGVDLTSGCTLTYAAEEVSGEGTVLTLTNNSGSDGYIIAFYITGSKWHHLNPAVRLAEDLDALDAYGLRGFDLDSPWFDDTEEAQDIADWLLANLVDASDAPIIRLEAQEALQFGPDLYERIALLAPTLGIANAFRVGGIEHETVGENCEAVRTTMYLEPYMVYDTVPETPVGCQLTRTAVQSIPHNTITNIVWDSEVKDEGGFHSGSDAYIEIPYKMGGVYRIYASVQWDGDGAGTGRREINIFKNGTQLDSTDSPAYGISDMTQYVVLTARLAWADKLYLRAFQTSGGALDVNRFAAPLSPIFGVEYLGAYT
jgi:hypothetical protein